MKFISLVITLTAFLTSSTAISKKRDVSAFISSLNDLQTLTNTFASDLYTGGGPTLTPNGNAQLIVISNHIKNITEAFDTSFYQLAQTETTFNSKLSTQDAQTINSTIPLIQSTLLRQLQNLSSGKAFFEVVNNNPQWLLIFCHWVKDLNEEHVGLLGGGGLGRVAPSTDFSSFWSSLATQANSAYQIAFLNSIQSGFGC